MRFTCPSCNAEYMKSSAKIGSGLDMTCERCKSTFHIASNGNVNLIEAKGPSLNKELADILGDEYSDSPAQQEEPSMKDSSTAKPQKQTSNSANDQLSDIDALISSATGKTETAAKKSPESGSMESKNDSPDIAENTPPEQAKDTPRPQNPNPSSEDSLMALISEPLADDDIAPIPASSKIDAEQQVPGSMKQEQDTTAPAGPVPPDTEQVQDQTQKQTSSLDAESLFDAESEPNGFKTAATEKDDNPTDFANDENAAFLDETKSEESQAADAQDKKVKLGHVQTQKISERDLAGLIQEGAQTEQDEPTATVSNEEQATDQAGDDDVTAALSELEDIPEDGNSINDADAGLPEEINEISEEGIDDLPPLGSPVSAEDDKEAVSEEDLAVGPKPLPTKEFKQFTRALSRWFASQAPITKLLITVGPILALLLLSIIIRIASHDNPLHYVDVPHKVMWSEPDSESDAVAAHLFYGSWVEVIQTLDNYYAVKDHRNRIGYISSSDGITQEKIDVTPYDDYAGCTLFTDEQNDDACLNRAQWQYAACEQYCQNSEDNDAVCLSQCKQRLNNCRVSCENAAQEKVPPVAVPESIEIPKEDVALEPASTEEDKPALKNERKKKIRRIKKRRKKAKQKKKRKRRRKRRKKRKR